MLRNIRVFLIACLPAIFPQALAGGQSLVLAPGKSLPVTVPASGPFNAINDTRIEYRLHDWTTPPQDSILFTLGGTVSAPYLVAQLTSTSELCIIDHLDYAPDYGGEMCADISGVPDVVVRIQRDAGNLRLNYEVRTVTNEPLSTYCGLKWYGGHQTFGCPMRQTGTTLWGGNGEIGDPASAAHAQLGWLKWYSSLVPQGDGNIVESSTADLADWRFEGNTDEAAGGGLPALQGSAQYSGTPLYPPACSAGRQQVFRAGYPAQLDGSVSYPLDGGTTLAYAWVEVSGPSRARLSGSATPNPAVSGMVFGSYVFRLTVTDGSNQSTSCTIKHGAVATDDNGVVITDNPAIDALIGPQMRYGAGPWPWFDNRHRAAADLQAKNLDLYYPSYWDTQAEGMVTVTPNSSTVTGLGTSFTTLFCQGPENPTKAKDGVGILVWHPTGVLGETGRRWLDVTGCQSDTQLTTAQQWTDDLPGGTMAFSYADGQSAGTWNANIDPVNFYDNVVGFYTLYYRSGFDEYLTAARKLADRFWLSPRMDQGKACEPGSGFCTFPRNISQLGLVLRAIDGRPDMWPGLRAMWSKFMYNVSFYAQFGQVEDAREQGYELAMVAYCALVEPDPMNRAACKNSVSASFPIAWTPFRGNDRNWPTLWYPGPPYSSWDSHSTVTLTNGSTAVTGTGTAWTLDQFPNSGASAIWFTNSINRPADNSGGDPTWYTATWVDGNHLTLDRPYEGTSGIHGWLLGGTVQPVGWGAEPFVLGILATAFDFAARAIEDSDPATAALAHSYNVAAVNWLRTTAYWPTTKGLYYQAGQVNCQPPISDANAACTDGNGISAARTLNAMVMRPIGAAYLYSSDPSLKDFGDMLFSAMYSKPGTGGPTPDGSYVSDLDDATGWYMTGAPPIGSAPKYFGMFFGFGDNSSWPAYRLGGPQPAYSRTIRIGPGHLQNAAVSMRVTVTEPNGAARQAICGLGACAFTVDGRQGDPAVTVEYLSAANAVLGSEPGEILRAARQ